MVCQHCGADNSVDAPFCSLCYVSLIQPSARTAMREPAIKPEPGSSATMLFGIIGTEGMSVEQLRFELRKGGRVVSFRYCISALLVTFDRSSSPRLIKAGEGAIAPGVKYSLISFLLGWWGIPFGFVYTPAAIYANFKGGRDATGEYIERLEAYIAKHMHNPYTAPDPYGVPDITFASGR